MSGVVPQVAAVMGPCAAGTAYIPGLADFVPMVSGRGSMALAGPHLVRAAIGEDVTPEELGGARIHCRKSGVGDVECADDAECIAVIKRYLSFFPASCEATIPTGRPPIRARQVITVRAHFGLRSSHSPWSTISRITSYMSYGLRLDSGRTSSSPSSPRSAGSAVGRRGGGSPLCDGMKER